MGTILSNLATLPEEVVLERGRASLHHGHSDGVAQE